MPGSALTGDGYLMAPGVHGKAEIENVSAQSPCIGTGGQVQNFEGGIVIGRVGHEAMILQLKLRGSLRGGTIRYNSGGQFVQSASFARR